MSSACIAGQVTEATIELGCYPPLASSWRGGRSQVDLWGPGVPNFMKSSTYEWDNMGAILDLCEEIGFLEGKGPVYEAEEEARRELMDFQLLAGLGQDISEFTEAHNFIDYPEHAEALDKWLSGDEHGLESCENTIMLETHFEEDQGVSFGEEIEKGKMMLEKMGWSGGPLGCRGKGITEPIKAEGSANDTTGLGYQIEEFFPPYEGEEITDSVEMIGLGTNYGVGMCSRGTVFIPRGSLRHMNNLFNSRGTRDTLIGENFVCELVARPGKHPWRLNKVVEIEMTWSAIE